MQADLIAAGLPASALHHLVDCLSEIEIWQALRSQARCSLDRRLIRESRLDTPISLCL
jgi:hypothetical protein